MSEVLEEYKKRKLDWKLKLSSEAPLSYVKRQVDFVLCGNSMAFIAFVEQPS